MPFKDWVEKTKDTKGFLAWTGTITSMSCIFTWAAFKFVFDDNKIASYEAKSQASEAKANQYSAKVDVLEREILALRSENKQFRTWLESDPKSFIAMIKRISDQDVQIKLLSDKCGKISQATILETTEYAKTMNLKKGEAFVDPKSKAIFGVSEVSVDREVTGTITFPNGKTQKIDKIRPGQVWEFVNGGKKYQMLLKRAEWIDNAVVIETTEKN